MAEHVESGSPTDNSATLTTTFSTTFDTSHSQPSSGYNPLDITRDELEKRELAHTVQLLRLEVSQKQLMIDALKNEQASEVEELREQLADAQHEKKLVKLRLQSLTHAFGKEMEEVRKRRRDAPVQSLVGDFHHEVDQAFDDVGLSSDEYEILKAQDTSLLSISQLVKIRCHELTQPLRSHCGDLQLSMAELKQQLTDRDRQLTQCQEKLSSVREEKAEVESRYCSLCEELASVRSKVQEGNYKINNFDSVKKERDSLCSELEKLKTVLSEQELRESLVKEDLHKSMKQCSSVEQSVGLLRQDKEYLTRQVSSLHQRVTSAEERVDYLNTQLSEAKQAKESLYQQLISDKEKCREDFDLRLQRELEDLKSRTSLQIDQLKLQTREFYERENHTLCEARDAAIADKERTTSSEKEVRSLYEQLLNNYHSLQASSERQSCELEAQLKITNFEKERAALANQETLSQLKHCQLDREKLGKKLDLLNHELCSVQHEGETTVRRLEDQLEQMKQRIEGYEKIEQELDDIVLQSAQMEHESDAERVLFSYGFGTSIPTNSRRRLQQSVHLARRVLQLEKLNSSLRQQLGDEQSRTSQLKEQLSSVEELLLKTGQPQSYMVKAIRDKEKTVQTLQSKVKLLEGELARSREERAQLVETKNQMSADLEKLLSHREELHLMRKVLVGVAKGEELWPVNSDTQPAMHIPQATLFTKRDQQKGQSNKSPSSDR